MFLIKAFAEPRSGRTGSRGGRVSTPSRPTSVQGRIYEQYGNAFIGGSGRGRPARATYVAPRASRGRRG